MEKQITITKEKDGVTAILHSDMDGFKAILEAMPISQDIIDDLLTHFVNHTRRSILIRYDDAKYYFMKENEQ